MSDAIYINAYKGGDSPNAPKVKGKIYAKDLKKLVDAFEEGCDFAIFKNKDAGTTKTIKGKPVTVSDFSIKFSAPFKANSGSKNSNSRQPEESDF